MFDALRVFFQAKASSGPAPTPLEQEQALRLAAGALLFEVMRADNRVEDSERTVMRTALQSTFSLTPDETIEVMRVAEERSRQAISIYEFTSMLDTAFSPAQKKRIVELLWLVAFADGEKDAHEEHMVRRIASLLHVPHPDFIDAKIRARDGGAA